MIEAPVSTPPQAYMNIISSLIDRARGFLEAGEKLQPMAFVGNLNIPLKFSSLILNFLPGFRIFYPV